LSTPDDRAREVDLTVQLKRTCLNGYRARRGLRLRPLVNDPEAYAQPRQPQCQHQAGRPCDNNQDVGLRTVDAFII
jgi:hypothetical protein